jgi:hypothetical protein
MDDINVDEKRTITVYATPQNVEKCMDDLAEVLVGAAGRFEVTVLDVTADPQLLDKVEETPTVVFETPGWLGVIVGAHSADSIRSGLGIRQG